MTPYEEFNFEGQFEDVLPSERYENLSNGPALKAAKFYFEKAAENKLNIKKGEEFLRFAEDQFVVWSDPQPRPSMNGQWLSLPCAMEQYKCYVPIDVHAASFVRAFFQAYQVTNNELYLAKAIALANSITRAQDPSSGIYPTWWINRIYDTPGWINCAIETAIAMDEFGKEIDHMHIRIN